MSSPPPFFLPWVGDGYGEGRISGKRILILGESHYQWDPEIEPYPELTVRCVLNQIEGSERRRFWTNVAMAFLGRRPDALERAHFWHSVSFYNYVQESVGMGPRVRPTHEMWTRSAPSFEHVLHDLRPDFLLVLGYALWHRIPALDRVPGPEIAGSKQPVTWRYPLGSETCLAYGVRHPSAGFSGRYWHQAVQEALRMA